MFQIKIDELDRYKNKWSWNWVVIYDFKNHKEHGCLIQMIVLGQNKKKSLNCNI